jgi:zinc transport system substrate-binding protein
MSGARKFIPLLGLVSLLLAVSASPAAAELKVVASLGPVHSLVAAVMGARGTPILLIPAGQSEHTSVLRPSTARALAEASVVFRIARGFETALDKPLGSLAGKSQVVELARAPGVNLLRARSVDEDTVQTVAAQPGDLFLWADLHVWLDPQIAKAMTAEVVRTLSRLDPEGAGQFAANGVQEAARLDALDAAIAAELKPVLAVPFVVFHDAYQYFEHRYQVSEVGRVEVSPERAPSARHLALLRDRIKASGAVCVFSEPQIEPRILPALTDGLNVRIGVLDPLGAGIAPGPDLYASVLKGISLALRNCLKP